MVNGNLVNGKRFENFVPDPVSSFNGLVMLSKGFTSVK